MSAFRNSLYTNPFLVRFTGMCYARRSALDDIPYIEYTRYRYGVNTNSYIVLVADKGVGVEKDDYESGIKIQGWVVNRYEMVPGVDGYAVKEPPYLTDIVIWPEDTAVFHYKSISIRNSAMSAQEFADKIAPYVSLAYTENALDGL